jgi:hypothetical protein
MTPGGVGVRSDGTPQEVMAWAVPSLCGLLLARAVPCPALWREPVHFKRLPACQTILNVIGNFLADGCQVEQFLFAEDIFGFFGKLPIHRRLVSKVIIPIHACHGA